MQSFVYPTLNRTCRDKDKSQIKHYGAFAAALSYILYFANKYRKDRNEIIQGTTNLFRGVQLPLNEVERYQIGQVLCLRGYTSTSKYRSEAEIFALNDLPNGMCPVLYDIEFTGNEGLFYLSDLNYTAFMEREVLVQDGLEYRITAIREVHISKGKTLT